MASGEEVKMGRFDAVVQLANKVISGESTPKEAATLAEATKKLATLVDTATMSTWDGYAMAALSIPTGRLEKRESVASAAAEMADAMMAERARRFAPTPPSPPAQAQDAIPAEEASSIKLAG